MKNKQKKQHTIDFVFVLLVFCVFTMSSLAVIYIGSHVYAKTADTLEDNFNQMTLADYLQEKIHQNLSIDSIDTIQVEGYDILCLHESYEEKKYTTYLYNYKGYVKELLISNEQQFELENGENILEADDVTFTIKDSLLTITITYQQESKKYYISLLGGKYHDAQ